MFTAYLRDISEQKRREAALLESEAIVDSSFDAIIGRTTAGIVTSWNAAAERIFGYSAEEMVGRPVASLVAPESRSILAHVNECIGRGEVVEPIEAVCVRGDGSRVDVEVTVSSIIGAAGDVIGVSAIARDITERKRSQALATGQADLLEFVAGGAALPDVLDHLARFVEKHGTTYSPPSCCSIAMECTCGTGRLPASRQFYSEAIDGAAIGPSVGSCGTAAYRRERVCVSDIASDPLWSDFSELALSAGLRPAGRHRSSRPTARCSARSRCTTGRRAGAAPATSSSSSSPPTWPASRSSAHAPRRGARQSDERYRDLFENANEPIASVMMDETITRSTVRSNACSATTAPS